MIRHVVVFQFRSDTPPRQIETIDAALARLAERLDILREYQFGAGLGLPASNGDYAITALVDGAAAFQSYVDDEEHQKIATELIDPYATKILAIQFEVAGSVP